MEPVTFIGLESVHGHGHHAQRNRHAQGRDEHPALPLLPQGPTHDNEQAAQDNAGEVGAEFPRDRERERRWLTRAADTLHGFRPPPAPSTAARHESTGPGPGSGASGARTGDDGHGSTTFFIYVIGGTSPRTVFLYTNDSCAL